MARRNPETSVTFLGPLRYGQGCWKFMLLQPYAAPLELSYGTRDEAKQAYSDMARVPGTVKVARRQLFDAIVTALKQARGEGLDKQCN